MKKLLLLVGLVVLVNGAIFAKDIFDDKRFQKLCGWVQDPEHRGTCWCFSGTKGNKSFKSVNGNAVLTEKGWNCPKGNWGYAISLKNKEEKWSSYRGTGEFEIGSTWGEFRKPKKGFLPLEKDSEFQRFCNKATDSETATDMFCHCAGQFKDFSKAYSEKELIENPDIVSRPTTLDSNYLKEHNLNVEFAEPHKNSRGMWTCPASFFGIKAAKNAYYEILGRSEDIGKKVKKTESTTTTKKTNTTSNKSKSVKEKLLELKKLFDEGLITKDVYEKKQLELLE
jgi:hypothetical protein